MNLDYLSDKYDADVNGITTVAGTFTDRLTAEQLNDAIKMGQTIKADPLLYNLIQVMFISTKSINFDIMTLWFTNTIQKLQKKVGNYMPL